MSHDVVGVVGGLGNQLFQHAFARWLERRTGRPCRLDLSAYRTRPDYLALPELLREPPPEVAWVRAVPHPLGRAPRVARLLRTAAGPRRVVTEAPSLELPEVDAGTAPAWYYGYWQHPAVVDEVIDRIRHDLRTAEPDGPVEPIAVHVRRGDMLGHPSAVPAAWFPRAMAALRDRHGLRDAEVAVYSDDPGWCREFLDLPRARVVPPGSAAADLLALSRHPHLVLSGSTFSWWAARLRRRAEHAVVAPRPFSMVPGQRLEQPGWLLVDRADPAALR